MISCHVQSDQIAVLLARLRIYVILYESGSDFSFWQIWIFKLINMQMTCKIDKLFVQISSVSRSGTIFLLWMRRKSLGFNRIRIRKPGWRPVMLRAQITKHTWSFSSWNYFFCTWYSPVIFHLDLQCIIVIPDSRLYVFYCAEGDV